jgi:hypothetical protein
MLRKPNLPKRNDPCPCDSGLKFKNCCGVQQPVQKNSLVQRSVQNAAPFIDTGEEAIRWMIVDSVGTKIFADVSGQAIVFQDKDHAYAVTQLEEFSDQEPGELNVAGVGPTKFERLKEKIPYIEVDSAEQATTLVLERLKSMQNQEAPSEEKAAEEPEQKDE